MLGAVTKLTRPFSSISLELLIPLREILNRVPLQAFHRLCYFLQRLSVEQKQLIRHKIPVQELFCMPKNLKPSEGKNPTTPERLRKSQDRAGKSTGKRVPSLKNSKTLKRSRATESRIILTGIAPTSLDAAAKNCTLKIQHSTVTSAIASQVNCINVFFFYFLTNSFRFF
jgi:hypothetical protein